VISALCYSLEIKLRKAEFLAYAIWGALGFATGVIMYLILEFLIPFVPSLLALMAIPACIFMGLAAAAGSTEKRGFQWPRGNIGFQLGRKSYSRRRDSSGGRGFLWTNDAEDRKYVYIISHPNYEGEYKVGYAKDVQSRLNSYQTGDPDREYEVEYEYLTENYREIEKHIHNTFDSKGEWVRADLDEIIDEIESYGDFRGWEGSEDDPSSHW